MCIYMSSCELDTRSYYLHDLSGDDMIHVLYILVFMVSIGIGAILHL